MKNTLSSSARIPMPARYGINLALTVLLWGALVLMMAGGVISNYWQGIMVTVGINVILAVSLNIATGYLGQLPLGHAGFMAVGAYAGGLFMKATPLASLISSGDTAATVPWIILALLISGLVAAVFGLIIGIPALRLKGDYLAILTLGFGEIIRVVITNIDSVLGFKFTYGAAGLKQIPKISNFTLVFLCVALTCLIIHMVMKSRHGRAILSIRENEIAAESCGINITYYKVMAFALSAFFAGIAGCLYAGYLGSLFPSTFKFMKSIEILVMVVLGGMGSMLGSVLAATVLTVVSELLRSLGDLRMVFYSLILVVMMIFRPKGLLGTYDFSVSRILEKCINMFKSKSSTGQEANAESEGGESK
ncbi:MAG: branched-chain amino acid ABC transporter permease [Oscillospiraceae bacterium]|nr:branched-chain amino acid ABC transporter permease [Oscillospiraceae bacterium]